MSKDKEFKLPGSGYDVVCKVLHAYVVCGKGKASLGDVAAKAGIDSTMVSRNNGFLLSIGALQGGRDKELTGPGRDLAIAIGNNIDEDIKQNWKQVFLGCERTKSVLDMVKIQKGITKSQFTAKVASALGLVVNPTTKTGINTLTDIFEKAQLLKQDDGKYVVHEDALTVQPADEKEEIKSDPDSDPEPDPVSVKKEMYHGDSTNNRSSGSPEIHINVQVHISPESTPEQIEKIFESMRKHLYERPNE
ncbi:hypothetical protein HZ994_00660 [Akkermansiaceae bacterium]|nr:hypothetical protein HZ994_00660 [Akkermansiaceae bacterium]